jgi:O-acetyl-ADP-ribose deacetylase (regulator of RNase III)
MSHRIFIVQGDISRFSADAVAYSTSTQLGRDGYLYAAFQRNVPGFEEKFAELGAEFSGRCRIGEAFWLPLENPPGGKPYGVVVTPAAGQGPSREVKRPKAVTAALETAIQHLPASKATDERALVALPTFGFGMGGDRWRRLESARAQLLAAKEVLDRHDKVDAAVVAYTADSYEIFLQARRDVGLADDDLLEPPAVPELVDAMRRRECVVFVGAGLSQGAGLPGWATFIHHLAQDLGAPHTSELEHFLDVAQWYLEEKGEKALAEQIRRHFGPGLARPTLPHYLLMSLPVRVVVTTNYDDLLEQALEALRRHPMKIIEEGDVSRTGHGEGVSIVKLHGDAAGSARFVLSRDDFDRFLRQRPAMAALFEALLLNHSFFFVGYGLRDPNFRQIHSRIADMLQSAQRKAFSIAVDAAGDVSPYLQRQWANKGLHLLFMPGDTQAERVRNVWRFLDQLAEAVSSRSLFLAGDADFAADQTPRWESLRTLLRDRVGPELQRVVADMQASSSGREAALAAQVLGFLTDHGWRPKDGASLSRLWEHLAQTISEPYDRQRLLIRALRHAEDYQDILRLREQLAALG